MEFVMYHRVAAIALLLCAFAAPISAQSFTLVTQPAGAKIFGLDAAGNRVQLGIGSAKVKLEKNAANRFWISADGFATLDTVFVRDIKYEKSVTIALVNRVVKVTALPYDAQIRVNGEPRGTSTADVVVPPNVPVTVEVSKGGYKPEKKVYHNESGAELPLTERFELKDRLVNVQPKLPRNIQAGGTPPAVSVDGTEVGTGNVDVVVPFDKCVTATVSLESYKPEPRTLCNKAGSQPPEAILPVALVDRLVQVTTSPQDAEIVVDNKVVGTGNFALIVRDRACVKVLVRLVSYANQRREYCNTDNMNLEATARVELGVDESYSSSVQTDQANVNFTIEVGADRTPEQAWQTISQVVLGAFDVLEITDKDTGYLRTSWEVSKFSNAVIRTRVIVKLGSSSPLKYVVKIASERADDPNASVKDDELFSEWTRVLKTYKDIINEMQARLR
jgi:hypothetical protein